MTLLIAAVGIAGIWGCVALQYVAIRDDRRRRVKTASGSALRLLDGERFPLALTNYEGE